MFCTFDSLKIKLRMLPLAHSVVHGLFLIPKQTLSKVCQIFLDMPTNVSFSHPKFPVFLVPNPLLFGDSTFAAAFTCRDLFAKCAQNAYNQL